MHVCPQICFPRTRPPTIMVAQRTYKVGATGSRAPSRAMSCDQKREKSEGGRRGRTESGDGAGNSDSSPDQARGHLISNDLPGHTCDRSVMRLSLSSNSSSRIMVPKKGGSTCNRRVEW